MNIVKTHFLVGFYIQILSKFNDFIFVQKQSIHFDKRFMFDEIISIMVINGSRTAGTPLGTKILRYLRPCFANPIIVTDIKINKAKIKVTMIWLVTVNEYGSMPTMLQNKTNMNKLKIKGK